MKIDLQPKTCLFTEHLELYVTIHYSFPYNPNSFGTVCALGQGEDRSMPLGGYDRTEANVSRKQ